MVSPDKGAAFCAAIPKAIVMDDVRRAREFYRYLQPDNLLAPQLRRRSSTFDTHHDHVPSLSRALSPFCQLASVRCKAAKAMLNVMDRDIMYFLAEASMQRSNNEGEEILAFFEDPILMSCSSAPLKGRICELTLKMDQPDDPGNIPTFVINDLTKSPFADMAIIRGPPYYRFYAGVPIRTRKGVNIGSIAVMDTRARPNGLTTSEEEFLGEMAEQIMTYLETNRQAIEGRRSRRMAQGLEAFIGGKKSIEEEEGNPLSGKTLKRRAKAAYGIQLETDDESGLGRDRASKRKGNFKGNAKMNSSASLDSEISSSAPSTENDDHLEKEPESESRSHARTFARAANLLRECLGDLGEDGSVHFVSLTTRLGANARTTHSVNGGAANLPRVDTLNDMSKGATSKVTPQSGRQSFVLASSTPSDPIMSNIDDSSQVLELDDDTLRDFMRRYPGGRLWSLDESTSSSSEDDTFTRTSGPGQRPVGKTRRPSRRTSLEHQILSAAFPNARQILFTPVWDAGAGSFSYGCFIASSLETRSFSTSSELPFLNSFCSTVMAECSRLDTMMADKQKSDFVGTISHEMRSPLHGVLASVEFLADTDLTSFQQSLIDTIDSCGRTLLDTINHVLDFSKVNSFQKQWQAANKKGTPGYRRNNYLGPENSSRAMSIGAPPLLQLFGLTDISTVLEEVVDGLVLGQTYSSGIDITDTSREARGRTDRKTIKKLSSVRSEPVEIILDVEHGDWTFMTQPGAVRRIIMNITGNAIKYTSQGTILVQLRQKDSDKDGSTRIMVLTVTDTGKGISPEFLTSRLFVPFAQENALAPGTGLGMSIVRSIVLMLGGTIDVKSRLGKGTTVEVAVPMKRPLPGQVSSQNTPHSGGTGVSGNSSGDDSILLLQNQASDETVAFYRPKVSAGEPLAKAVNHYLKDWYGLECVDPNVIKSSSVVIVEEEDLEHLMDQPVGPPGKQPVLVVMCSVTSRHSTTLISSLEERLHSPVEFVARPCGPNKLARSIRCALEKKRSIKPRFASVANLGVIPEANTPGSSLTASTPCDPAGKELHELDLGGHGHSDQIVQATENFAASQMSQNAQMAINDPSPALRTPRNTMSDHDAFPFPSQPETISPDQRGGLRSRGPSFSNQHGEPPRPVPNGTKTTPVKATPPSATVSKINPHVLLVDDNKINLRLLETFLKRKRNYSRIEQAEDGQEAVNAVKDAKEQYDIIFMDISMPIMNGFEATRAIRDFEEQGNVQPGAMVIALTGLASGRDQSEGFNSGCDIYMTKPVSFKEVGKLLDNWEGHQIANADLELSEKLAMMSLRRGSNPNAPVAVNGDHIG